MINVKSNAITRNVRILYQLKRTGGSIQYGNHHGNCTSTAIDCLLCIQRHFHCQKPIAALAGG